MQSHYIQWLHMLDKKSPRMMGRRNFVYLADREVRITTSTVGNRSEVIFQRAQPQRRPQRVLKEEPQPLHRPAIGHELAKLRHVRIVHVNNRRESRGRLDVPPHGPRSRRAHVVRVEHERAKKLRALGVRRVLEDRHRLRPGDEVAGDGREREVERRVRSEADRGRERRDVRPVRVRNERRGRARPAHEARILREERVEPRGALLAEDEVERVQDGVVVVGECEHELVLELGPEEVCELDRRAGGVDEVDVPNGGPVEDEEAVVEPVLVPDGLEDLVEADRLVGEQYSLGLPAREVVQGL